MPWTKDDVEDKIKGLTDKQKEELAKEGVEIIDLKSRIGTDEIPNRKLTDPEIASKKEFDLSDHKKNSSEKIKVLFEKLNKAIKGINSEIWDKYSKTAITYYSPEKMFAGVHLRKNSIALEVYSNTQKLNGFENIPNHENWSRTTIHNENELTSIVPSLKESFDIMKKAEEEGINTGWYAITPEEKMTWKNTHDLDEEEIDDEN